MVRLTANEVLSPFQQRLANVRFAPKSRLSAAVAECPLVPIAAVSRITGLSLPAVGVPFNRHAESKVAAREAMTTRNVRTLTKKSPARWPGFSFFKSKILRPQFAFPLVALHLKIPNPPEYVQASVHVLQRQSAFQRL
jgi:hypothetical protein